MRTTYLKLRANIVLDGDVSIAEREIKFFCKKYFPVKRNELDKVKTKFNLSDEYYLSNTRKSSVIGFIGIIEGDINPIILKSSFIQEIWIKDLTKTEKVLSEKHFCQKSEDNLYCFAPLFPIAEFLTYFKRDEIKPQTRSKYFAQHLANINKSIEIESVVRKSSTSTPHAHGLHKYKAKFFPRLIRSLLVTEI